ncbi:MAG TPA: response regulator transcription factor [Anaerolineaceae bacterium]|nr:response regulator transcription factor [Anaerolineaceae bacterium]HPN51353.1 response regulator transcription factor [Anaerolineaceae bacterium]
MRVLLVEDNRRLSNSVRLSLVDAGYAVDCAFTGNEGQDLAEMTPYDVIILDIMLPEKNGLDICRDLRKKRINTPVLMLTARDTIDDRVAGLDSGADDYLVKPFAIEELQARLRALLRRESENKSGQLHLADLTLDPATHYVQRGGVKIDLTAKEFSLLEFFMRHPNRLITREMAESHIWSYDFQASSNVIDVYIRRLRSKIDDPFEVKLLETVRGSGYRLRLPDAPPAHHGNL